jgi:hypothetical protein
MCMRKWGVVCERHTATSHAEILWHANPNCITMACTEPRLPTRCEGLCYMHVCERTQLYRVNVLLQAPGDNVAQQRAPFFVLRRYNQFRHMYDQVRRVNLCAAMTAALGREQIGLRHSCSSPATAAACCSTGGHEGQDSSAASQACAAHPWVQGEQELRSAIILYCNAHAHPRMTHTDSGLPSVTATKQVAMILGHVITATCAFCLLSHCH